MRLIKRTWQRCRHFIKTAAAVAGSASLVVACGGGGGGGAPPPPPPSVSISVAPSAITLGQTATLTWSSNTGTSCTASGGWSGAQSASGSVAVTPTAAGTVTYTLSCSGGAYSGSTSQSTTLTVNAPSGFTATALVADTAGAALVTDPNLVNAWGIAFGPTSFVWVANNHSETSTLYDGNGHVQPAASPLVVSVSAGASSVSFDPTGIVFNGSATDFVVTQNASSGAAAFIFSGEGGTIGGWAPSVDLSHTITTYTDGGGAVYKGLAIAKNGANSYLYATDFFNGKVDVFDTNFVKQTTSATTFGFVDSTLPAGYAPFGIQAVSTGTGGATQLIVTYAQQDAINKRDEVAGAGLGIVDVFDTNGTLVTHLVAAGGLLNAPWGVALAPSDFGTLSGALLVGNFGDGKINGFNAATGTYIGTVVDSTGAAFAVPGLWGIAFGNDAHNQPHNSLFYAAGTNGEANGLYGRLDLGGAPVLNAPPVVAVTAPAAGPVKGAVTITATATDVLGIIRVEFFLNGTTSLGIDTTSPYSVQWDSTTVADGAAILTAKATNANGVSATSAAVNVTVANTVAATTLTQIQTNVFTAKCIGCHDGSNPASGALPGSQNLTAGNSYTNLVNVASHEVPSLLRVKPNDPANSYLIQKLEGTAASGQRMPLGGPFLDQPTIDSIKSWINSGAPNN